MAWLTTYDATNRTDIEPATQSTYDRGTVGVSVGVFEVLSETVSNQRFKYTGMTKATAQTCANSFNAIADTQARISPTGGGGYQTEITYRNVVQATTPV